MRGLEFRLYYPKPRSAESAAVKKYGENRITFRPHFYFGENNHEIDFVLFLNGLPIVAMELKHEKNQTVHDAVAQFTKRDHACKIFHHPFLYLAADTSDVMAGTDPRREENFRWHNTGLTNTPQTAGEYPVEFLYREVLSKEHLLEALSFFLVRVPEREAEDDKPARASVHHCSRAITRAAQCGKWRTTLPTISPRQADIGRQVPHQSLCWQRQDTHDLLAGRPPAQPLQTGHERKARGPWSSSSPTAKSLDTNIKDDIENFTHLKDVVGLARKADDLPRFLKERKPIIVTTQQKFAWVLG